jgi:hypothetical protein
MTIRVEDGSVLYGCAVEWEKEMSWGYVYRLLSKDGEYYAQGDDDGQKFHKLEEPTKDGAVCVMKKWVKLLEKWNKDLDD